MFKLIIQNLDGSLKWEIPYDSFSITERLNEGTSGTFSFSEQTVKAISDYYHVNVDFILQAGYREVYLYDQYGSLIWGGYIGEPTSSRDENGVKTRTIAVNGWLDLLEARFTNDPTVATSVSFSAQHASAIIQALINYTQGLDYGDFGFTFGSMPTDETRDRTYYYDTIKEAIQKLSGDEVINGIDFEITPAKVINTYFPKGSAKPNLALVDGVNIRSYSTRTIFMNQMANEVFVFGEGQRDSMAIEVVTSSTTYKEPFFLLQRGLSEKDTATSTNLIKKGQRYLELMQAPRKIPTVVVDYDTPLYTDYSLGDSLPVVIPDESIDDMYRLKQRTLNDKGRVTLTFEETT